MERNSFIFKEEEEIVRDFVLKEIRKIEFGIKNREKKRK